MNRLSIKKIISSGFLLMLLRWQRFVKLSIIPLSFITLGFYSINKDLFVLLGNGLSLQDSIWLIIMFYMSMTWSINIHRMIILGDDAVGLWGDYLPHRRVGVYFMAVILLMVMILVVALISQLLIGLSMAVVLFIGYMIMLYLVVKMSIKFPAIATDDKEFMKQNLEKDNVPQLFFILILLPMIVSLLLGSLINLFGDNLFSLILTILLNIVMFYWGVVNLALCYQTLKGTVESE